jgi:hypothetical protein
MKSRFLSLSTLLLAFGLAVPANAQSFLRHQPDFFQSGREQFEREIQQQIQPETTASDIIILVHELPPMPPDFVTTPPNPKPSTNENNNTNQEQLPSTNVSPNQEEVQ